MVQDVAEREEQRRDLTAQVAELDNQTAAEVLFQEISPRRRPITIYSTTDGEPIPVPEYMVRAALNAVSAAGKPRFRSKKEDVPEYKLGEIKCFLHPESPEREILTQIGLGGASCPAAHLASGHAKRLHAEHRHKHEWAALQEHLNNQKEARREKRLDEQLAATLAIAGGAKVAPTEAAPAEAVPAAAAVPEKPISPCPVAGCPYRGTAKQLGGHRMAAHRS